MKKVTVGVLIVLLSSGAYASPLGTEITIFDGINQGATGWYGTQEDQEVEPGCATNQSWDLEGFFLDGDSLNMAGGFNFVSGNGGFYSGDLFIDVNGDAVYGSDILPRGGNGYQTVSSINYGYDYVLDLDFQNKTYNVVDLSGADSWLSVYYGQNDESNPYRYVSGGTIIGSGTIGYQTGLTNAQTGLTGGSHRVATFDLFDNTGWDLDSYVQNDILFHFTIGCGNDNLMGRLPGQPVPEPASLALMALGVGGLWLRTRRTRAV